MENTPRDLAFETARHALAIIAAATFLQDRQACAVTAQDALKEIDKLLAQAVPAAATQEEAPDLEIQTMLPVLDESMALPQGEYVIFTDGGCHGNPGPAGVGVSVLEAGTEMLAYGAYIGKATNQVAELSAAISGLQSVPEGSVIELVSDSQYVLKGLSEWRKGWEANGWISSSGKTVANLAYWKMLYAVADKRRVTTRWVKGHSGDVYNERCDQLANDAISQRNMGRMTEVGFL